MMVAGFLAGAYIAFGGLVAIAVSSGLDPKTWGTLPTLFTGSVFALGLVLTVVAGAELLDRQHGAGAAVGVSCRAEPDARRPELHRHLRRQPARLAVRGLLPRRQERRRHPTRSRSQRLAAIATEEGGRRTTDWQIFLRAVGCNWLVCLAVWMAMAAEDIAGKILAIFFPIMAFVAMGFDHVVANMFFIPAAIFAHVPGIDWLDALKNWLFAFLGNLVGAGVFVAGAYYYLYGRDETSAVAEGNGRFREQPASEPVRSGA